MVAFCNSWMERGKTRRCPVFFLFFVFVVPFRSRLTTSGKPAFQAGLRPHSRRRAPRSDAQSLFFAIRSKKRLCLFLFVSLLVLLFGLVLLLLLRIYFRRVYFIYCKYRLVCLCPALCGIFSPNREKN